jgi:hypothetical protein
MAINRGPWNALVDDDGSNLVGSIWNKAAIQTVLLDPIDAIDVMTPVTFNAAHYGVYPSGAWTVTAGNVVGFSYSRHNQTGCVTLQLANSVITGTPLLLSILCPLVGVRRTVAASRITIGGNMELTSGYLEPADNRIYLQRTGGQLFPAGTLVELSLTIPIFLA